MLKALLKKQFLEVNTFYFIDRKTGKRRSALGIIGFVLLFAFVFFSSAMAFFGMAMLFSDAFLPAGLDWLYFAMFAPMAIAVGSILDMFIASTTLYLAKDNDLLLSMPIPPRNILLVRMTGLYVWDLLCEVIVLLPVIVRYWMVRSFSPTTVLFPLLTLFFCTVTTLAISCVLGWIVALISARLKNNAFVTVFISLALIGLYYVLYFRMSSILQSAVQNADTIAETISKYLFPIYHLGLGASGNLSSLLITGGLSLGLFALVTLVLEKTFIRTATMNLGAKKTVYVQKEQKKDSVPSTLLKREFRRFFAIPAYMLNAGLGVLILPISGILLLVNRAKILPLLDLLTSAAPWIVPMVPLALAAACCLVLAMDCFSCASVSLEGKTLWILQTLPADASLVLDAKVRAHVIINLLPCVLFPILAGIALGLGADAIVLTILLALTFTRMIARLGLAVDLRHPILDWKSETVPIKQGLGTFACIFGGWGIVFAAAGIGYLVLRYTSLDWRIYIVLLAAVFTIFTRLLDGWLHGKGSRLFEELS